MYPGTSLVWSDESLKAMRDLGKKEIRNTKMALRKWPNRATVAMERRSLQVTRLALLVSARSVMRSRRRGRANC